MSPRAQKVVTEALQLPREARALIAEKLLESLEYEEPFQVSTEWKAEIRRRFREVDSGKVDLALGGRVLREARDRLR